jgi:hypothetical protein
VTTPGDRARPAPVTDSERRGLLDALSVVPDLCHPRGTKTSRETAYLVTSLPTADTLPTDPQPRR